MDRKEIFESIIDYIRADVPKAEIVPSPGDETQFGEEDAYVFNSFKIKGHDDWAFGIWIMDNDNGGYDVCLFGEHEHWHDKLKPGHCAIDYEFSMEKDESDLGRYEYGGALPNMSEAVATIVESESAALIRYYYTRGSVVSFLARTLYEHKVVTPLNRWWEDKGMRFPLSLRKVWLKVRFGRRVSVNIRPRPDCFSPKWEMQIVYREEPTYELYERIVRNTRMHGSMGWNVDVIHAKNENDWRGFYFNKI